MLSLDCGIKGKKSCEVLNAPRDKVGIRHRMNWMFLDVFSNLSDPLVCSPWRCELAHPSFPPAHPTVMVGLGTAPALSAACPGCLTTAREWPVMFPYPPEESAGTGMPVRAAARRGGPASPGLCVCFPGCTRGRAEHVCLQSHTHTFLPYNILGSSTDVLGKLSLAQTSLQPECDFFSELLIEG